MKNDNKLNVRLYIALILCILIILTMVFKNKSYTASSNAKNTNKTGFLNRIIKTKNDISKIILQQELTWIKYYDKPVQEEIKAVAPFKLNDESIIKNEMEIKASSIESAMLKKKLDKNNPEVYVYSTHTTESFSSSSQDDNVSKLGELLCKDLEENYGIASKHDDTIHNTVYVGSYKHSREALENELDNCSSYKLIIDLHRDEVGDKKEIVTATIDGESTAKVMFVDDLSVEGIYENQKIMNDMIVLSNTLYPGFCRGKFSYEYSSNHFNQDIQGNIILIEVGASCNTYEEAKNSVSYLAKIIAMYLNGM